MRSTIVCVLGMHRSGTSLAARILNLLGAYLGPEDQLVAPAVDNPKGFWEYQPIVELNDAILRRLGGRSMAPPPMLAGWETAPELDDLAIRAREIVEEGFAGADLWAWKDPRACLTLPFWQRLLPPMRYVVCVRNPADVADSLRRRNRIARQRSVYLWLLYTHRILSDTAGQPRRIVIYDRLMDNPIGETAVLARFLGVPHRAEEQEVVDAVASFVDSGLRHHRTGTSVQRDNPSRDGTTAAIQLAETAYLVLADSEPLDEAEVDRLLRSGLETVDQAHSLIPATQPRGTS